MPCSANSIKQSALALLVIATFMAMTTASVRPTEKEHVLKPFAVLW
jgi:hypothetical protein